MLALPETPKLANLEFYFSASPDRGKLNGTKDTPAPSTTGKPLALGHSWHDGPPGPGASACLRGRWPGPKTLTTVEPRLATHRVQHHPRASIGNLTAYYQRPEGRWDAHNYLLSEQS